jgi:nudix-type nucleoside diphosphatase (YffH/AdpP family)
MLNKDAKIIERELVYDNFYKLYRVRIRLKDNSIIERHLEEHGTAAAVLPYDPDRKCCILISQTRAAVLSVGEPDLLEAVAGLTGKETPERTIRREAMEEAGLKLGHLTPIANIWKIPALSSERVQLYLCEYGPRNIIKRGGGVRSEGEIITRHEISLKNLREIAMSGKLPDAKTLILAQHLMLTRPDLFQ